MSSCYDIDSPDFVQMMLRKANAIYTVNKENIAHIEARKGQKVILKHRFVLQTKSRSNKKQTVQVGSNGDDNNHMFEIVDKASTKNVDDIIAAWRYHGESLVKEIIAIHDFINSKLVIYDDLVRLNNEYGILLDMYSQLPRQWVVSRVAVEAVMYNMEVLQVAIGDLHERVLDVVDSENVSQAVRKLMNQLCKGIDSFESSVPGAQFRVDFRGIIAESKADTDVASLNDCGTISCKHVLSGHANQVRALQPYILNDKQYLASASRDLSIKLWDMSNNTLVATLKGHTSDLFALTLYVHNGIQMLASGSLDSTIKLWDISNNTCVHTLTGHTRNILALAVYEKDDETILISGSADHTIKLWDIDTHSIIRTLQGHRHNVYGLIVYNHDCKAYLASSSLDRTINIWSLDDHALVRTLDGDDVGFIRSLLVANSDDTQILVSGDTGGKIKLWSVEDYECIGSINAHVNDIYSLAMIECDDKVCIVSTSWDKTIKIWDLESQLVMTTLHNNSSITAMAVFMNGNEACLATGDTGKNVKLWMK